MADLEIAKMLVLSTAHVSQETAQRIDREFAQSLEMFVEEGFWLPQFVRDEGWLFYARAPSAEMLRGAPTDLLRVLEFAVEHDCTWVMFDSDGPVIDELPSFEWTEWGAVHG